MFHYLLPNLGGDPANDEPLEGGVPNYYLSGAAWVDAAANVGAGCWYADESAFTCYYWKEPQGAFHADLRHTVDKELRPGERLAVNGPPAFFFGVEGASRAAFGQTIARVSAAALR